jgi:hypothetical protein
LNVCQEDPPAAPAETSETTAVETEDNPVEQQERVEPGQALYPPTGDADDMWQCARCGRRANENTEEFLRWEAIDDEEAVVCPDCLTPEERAQLDRTPPDPISDPRSHPGSPTKD